MCRPSDGTTIAGNDLSNGSFVGIRWTSPTGLQMLETGDHYYPAYMFVSAVSGDGSTIVGSQAYQFGEAPARWTAAGGLVHLADVQGHAYDASADGSVVVGTWADGTLRSAFRWTAAGGIADVFPVTVNEQSTALACSSDASAIVGEVRTGGIYVPYRWSADTGVTRLATVAGTASAISGDGTVVAGYVGVTLGNADVVAFRWTADGGLESLGKFPGTGLNTRPVAMSADGSVIVGATGTLSAIEDSWVWTQSQGMRSIRQILIAGGVDTSPFTMIRVNDISADGRTVVGSVRYASGQADEGFVALLPEPVMALPLVVLAVSCRRGRRV